MKRSGNHFIKLLYLTAFTLLLLAGCGGGNASTGSNESITDEGDSLSDELNVLLWTEYIPDSVIKKFEEEFDVRVNYNTFSSNEELLAKLSAGAAGYDLALSGDYMVEILIKQELLEPINQDNVPNMENLGEQYLGLEFDPENEFSIPFMLGNASIAVNTELVDKPVKSYKDLWDPQFENSLIVLDDQRILIGIANKIQGESMNATDPEVLEKSQQLLLDLMPNIKMFESDNAKVLLASGEAAAGIVWGADTSLAKRDNPAIESVIPEEGLNLYVDSFIIPKGVKHKKTAETFIDFILRPDISAEISEDFPYTNPNMAARELIDGEILEDPIVYPPDDELEKGEYLIDIEDTVQEYDRIWSEIKQ